MIDTLEGNRVKIREHCIEDLDAYLDWQCNDKVSTHLSWLPRTKKEARDSLLDAIAEQTNPDRQRFFMAIVRKDDEVMVGDVGTAKTSESEASVGWFLRPEFEGNGYAVEGARLMVDLCFRILKISSLRASCRIENTKSENIMEKLSFRMEKPTDRRLHYLLRSEDWEKQEI